MSDYAVVVVFSNWTLNEIFSFMEDFLKTQKSDIGLARIDKQKNIDGNYVESNRTIMLLRRSVLDKAVKSGLNISQPTLDFRISEYNLTDKHYPKETDKSNIYLNFPKDIPYEDVNVQIRDKLNIMKSFGLIKSDYNVMIPLQSRDSGEHNGYGYINFTQDDLTTRALVRLLLQDIRLYNDKDIDNFYYLRAFWVRNKTI